MSFRLGLLGGMFDPVHSGHLEAARYALRTLKLDQVRMIPCHNPHHRGPAHSDGMHRLSMLELATQQDPAIEVDPIELNRSGTSYTVDTLLELRKTHSSAILVLVLGVDSFNSLTQWHEWTSLFDLCHFLVLARPGSTISSSVAEQTILDERLVASTQELFAHPVGKVILAHDFEFTISSTTVRNKLVEHGDVADCLQRAVMDYIEAQGLYRK